MDGIFYDSRLQEQFNENENIGNNDNQIIQSSDDHSKDITNIVFQNIVDVLAITKQCKKIPDNQERFLRILFTIITSESLRNKFSSSDLGSKFGYYRKTIQKRLQQGLDYRNQIISGGNFHGQPLALALDYLKIAISELGNISERRTYQLVSGLRGLP